MTTVQISPQGSGVANGAGFFQFGQPIPQGTKWQLSIINLRNSSTVSLATATVYRGSPSGPLENIDQLAANNNGTTGKIAATPFYAGQWLWVVWTGCDPGATCVFQAYGVQRSRSDPDFDLAAIGDGFPTIPPQLIVGSPPGSGAAGVYIGPVLPAPLATLYAALTTVSRFNIEMSPDGVGYWYEIVGTFAGPRYFHAEGWVNGSGTVVEFEQHTTPVPNSVSPSTQNWGANSAAGKPFIWRFGGNQTSANTFNVQNSNIILGGAVGDIGSITAQVDETHNGNETHNGTGAHNGIETFNADIITAIGKSLGRGLIVEIVSAANSGAVTAGPTAVLTAAGKAYANGRAFRVDTGFGVQSNVAGATATFTVTNGVGAVVLNFASIPMSITATNLPATYTGYFVNTSGGTITTGMQLMLTHGGTASNLIHSASAALPRWMRIFDCGAAADFPGAISL